MCSIFIEIKLNEKTESISLPLKVFNSQHCTAHIQPSTIVYKFDSKKCVPFGPNSRGNYGEVRLLYSEVVKYMSSFKQFFK